ncbi:hypothetical protein ONS95_007732 [Cadophora gregata]|uniref:uncharacterized protein n=1 Tax=Cadophora gregata TaxID=51156 RepID=UPI0026DCE267|nr:uncharacterized protein ONS95_007732 [Cadophora gregata]KAK0118857.1 hypothetical protein ONS96_011937 [Cadophora gregata f. sp. sojae]KAK0126113.1 hypothetical protein ONS95_007732 [Cadophora gregata]
MPSSLPFRWINAFKPTPFNSNTDLLQYSTVPIDPHLDPRLTAQASIYNHTSYHPNFESDEGTTNNKEAVVEYKNIRHMQPQYVTRVDSRQWRRAQIQEDQEARQVKEQSQCPSLRRGSVYARIQAMLQTISWASFSSSCSSEPLPSIEFPHPSSTFSYDATANEAPEEDPLAFAKVGEVEVREGETEQISPTICDVSLGERGMRESAGSCFAAFRR